MTMQPTTPLMTTLAAAGDGHAGFWLGKTLGASDQAHHTEWLFMFIMWVNIISFIGLMAIMFYFVWRFRRSKQSANYQTSIGHNTPLELAWSIIPFMVMVPIFWWGMTGYVSKVAAPADAQEIYVTGKKWNWTFKYPSGAIASDLVKVTETGVESPAFVVEEGRPVKLIMTSDDVLHAFYIPDFRVKMDVIPNRYTTLTFTPKKAGEHTVFCAEYCGDFHSEMHAKIKVVSKGDFAKKIAEYVDPIRGTPAMIGSNLWKLKGCATCHTIDGAAGTGPTWKDAFGASRTFADGTTGVVDENYLRESILYSQKKIVQGYPPSMPLYAGQLKDEEVFYLTLYIKSLSGKMTSEERAKMEKDVLEQPDLPGGGPKKKD